MFGSYSTIEESGACASVTVAVNNQNVKNMQAMEKKVIEVCRCAFKMNN